MTLLKVLIVDDSLVFRHAVAEALSTDSSVKIIGSVRNGLLAMESIRNNRPDLVTLDIEMPEMDGIETLKEIQKLNRSHPELPEIAVLMLSSFTQKGGAKTIEALEMGAFDFITKPTSASETEGVETLRRLLTPRVSHVASLRSLGKSVSRTPIIQQSSEQQPSSIIRTAGSVDAIFIGVSTGGPKALTDMLPDLCNKVSIPIFVVQHMPENFTKSLAESLDKCCSHTVKEGEHNELIHVKTLYIAPGGQHMAVRRIGPDLRIILTDTAPENGCRPSVDVLFRSAASVFNNAIAVILTGMGNDGTPALPALKQAGIPIIVQDEKSSIVWGMPGSAVATGLVDAIVPLLEIPDKISGIVARKSRI